MTKCPTCGAPAVEENVAVIVQRSHIGKDGTVWPEIPGEALQWRYVDPINPSLHQAALRAAKHAYLSSSDGEDTIAKVIWAYLHTVRRPTGESGAGKEP